MIAAIRAAEESDIAEIMKEIRPEDVEEMRLLGTTPDDAMREGMARSDWAMTGTLDGRPVCMFGVAAQNILLGRGVPWMLASRGVERAQIKFLRACRPVVARMSEQYPHLRNVVHSKNTTAIRWLRWLGFRFVSEDEEGRTILRVPINGADFYLFTMEQSNV